AMTKKQAGDKDRDGILGTLRRFGRGKVLAPSAGNDGKPYVAPSRKNRKSITTWQDEAALKELRAISAETGISQQELIADGINYVLAKYRKRSVAR
ncbi:MAG: ribbon-helix-helix domain-containing protein, partial [Hyphomicrobiaceae bacterium]